jgi:hypothetical protein
MAVDFQAIEQRFREIFGFIQEDLSRIIQIEPGVNYAAAALIACACEALARYRNASGEGGDAFATLLPGGIYQTVAKTIYNALRNGLVHSYEAQDIQFNGSCVGLAIAWRETPHLSLREEDKPQLVLNIRELCERLSGQINLFREKLMADANARDRFLTQCGKARVCTASGPQEVQAWKELTDSVSHS